MFKFDTHNDCNFWAKSNMIWKSHLSICKRNSKIPSILCFLSRECMLCGTNFSTDLDIQTHLENVCLKDHFRISEENGTVYYSCNVCSSLRMPYAQIMEHSVTFCSRNYRKRCTNCFMMATRCKCTSHWNNLMETVHKIIAECKSFDLHNNSHRFISHIYYIYKMQFVMEKLNDIISTGEYVDEELNSIPQQSSCGIMNNIQVSYLIISMEEAGNGLEIH